jgi:hypothetical protein
LQLLAPKFYHKILGFVTNYCCDLPSDPKPQQLLLTLIWWPQIKAWPSWHDSCATPPGTLLAGCNYICNLGSWTFIANFFCQLFLPTFIANFYCQLFLPTTLVGNFYWQHQVLRQWKA